MTPPRESGFHSRIGEKAGPFREVASAERLRAFRRAVSATVGEGIALLAAYSAGLGVPFLLCAVFADRAAIRLKKFRRAGRSLQIAAGGVMIAMGFVMVTGQLSAFSFWLLQTFPVFQQIG